MSTDGDRKIGRRIRNSIFIVRQRAIYIIRIGRCILQRAGIAVDVGPHLKSGHDRVTWAVVGEERLIVASTRSWAGIRRVTKVGRQEYSVL